MVQLMSRSGWLLMVARHQQRMHLFLKPPLSRLRMGTSDIDGRRVSARGESLQFHYFNLARLWWLDVVK